MEMTQAQKLITSLLIDLHKHLEVDSEYDIEFIEKMISYDQLWAIPFKYSHLESEENQYPADVQETLKILNMWRIINNSLNTLNHQDKEFIVGNLPDFISTTENIPSFEGFDANNDTHYFIAETIIEDLNRFNEFEGLDINSHSTTTLPSYRRMKGVFDRLWTNAISKNGGKLSRDDLIEIFKAKYNC